MNQRLFRRSLGLCLALAVAVSAFGQGLYWESTRTGSMMGEKSETVKYYYTPKKFKSATGDSGHVAILRLDKEVMIMLNPKEKTYSEISFADMEKMVKKSSAQMDEKMAELQEKLKNMPEEQRKMVEQMMGNKMPGMKKESKVEVVKSGDTKKISGYSCSKFVVNQDGKELLTVWATKDVKDFETIRKDMEEFRQRMAAMNPVMRKGFTEGLKNIDGFPIETDMGDTMKEVVTKVEKKSIAASEFEIPGGYKKVKSPMMEGKEDVIK